MTTTELVRNQTEVMTHEVLITGWRQGIPPVAAAVTFTKYWRGRHGEDVKVSDICARMKHVSATHPFQWEMVQGMESATTIAQQLTNFCGVECHIKEMTND